MELKILLSELSEQGIKIWDDEGQLRVRAPKSKLTLDLRKILTERKNEILEILRQKNVIEGAVPVDIVPVERTTDMPLSFAQQRLWFLSQMETQSAAYNIPTAVSIKGVLHVAAVEKGLNEIVKRHESLRTTFVGNNGSVTQVISESQKIPLPLVDLRKLDNDKKSLEVKRLLANDAKQPFDLRNGPLLRTTLLKLEEDFHILLITAHHIVCDAWSIGVFIRELSSLYKTFSGGAPSSLPKLTVQHADYAICQRQWMKGEAQNNQLNYWKQQLEGAPQVLEVPTDRPRPPIQTFHGSIQRFEIESGLTQKLKTLSRQSEVTLYMTLLTAFTVLLFRYSSQEDIVVGSTIANRDHKKIEPLIGYFANTLALRIDLAGCPTFAGLLKRVRLVALGAIAHHDVPFEQVVEALQPERDLSHSPIFQIMFAFQNTLLGVLELSGLTLEPVELDSVTTKFDLTLSMDDTERGLKGYFEYNTDLFDADTITRMMEHYIALLEAITINPQQRISEISMITEVERNRLLVDWNDTTTKYPANKCIHRLFEEQVTRGPNAIALLFDNRQLTYKELDTKANQLAHHLQNLGVGPEVLVGICVERSVEMIIGLLGILKAGGAYLSLDSSYPGDHLAFMIEDSGLRILITQNKLQTKLISIANHETSIVNIESIINSQLPIANLQSSIVNAQNLAYIMYTSGSTGRPKGTCITHQSVVRLVKETNYATFSPDEVFFQFAPISFDASTLEIWGALLNGARLVIMPASSPTLEELGKVIKQYKVTTLWLTASLFNLMVEKRIDDLRSLKQLLVGGEALSVPHVQKAFRELKGCRIINGYGPTENTTFTCCYTISEEPETSIPIGRPISNTRVYILDKNCQPVPIGVPGELFAGGDGLARGYFNRPELTAEKFIEVSFDNKTTMRLYRTGDLVRRLSDGNIEFIGRLDNQVKIRGFRIEPGEIEATMLQHDSIKETALVVREDQPGNKQLIAYVVPEQNQISTDNLRQFLKKKLPDFMIPSAFVLLEAMPLTPNGKVDLGALPVPDKSDTSKGHVAPRNPIEEILAGIWSEILGLEQVGVYHDFFELGGHSLLATQLVSRVRDLLSVELPLRSIFESSTIAELVEHIKAARDDSNILSTQVSPVSRDGALPLSFAQERMWFLNQLEPDNPFYNVPIALKIKGPLNINVLEQSLDELIKRHEALRTTFVNVEGKSMQVIAPAFSVPLQIKDLQDLSKEEQLQEAQRLATDEARHLFNLERDHLLRVTLIKLGKEKTDNGKSCKDEHVLLLTMHHIISDGWSLGVFIHELAAFYKSFLNKSSAGLPDLPIQYVDFASWQRKWLTGDVLERQLDYWKKHLADFPKELRLPSDRIRPAVQTFKGSSETFEVDQETTIKLKNLSKRNGATLFMTLLSAFSTLLFRYSSQENIIVGTPIANRNRSEIESLIGFFVNTLALRIDLSGNPTFKELIDQVRQLSLDAYAHQDLPFEKLVDELHPERDLSRNPLFQVMFALQNAPMGELRLTDLSMSVFETKRVSAQFDIVLDMWEADGKLVGVMEYSTDMFDATTIIRMIGHFKTLLAGIVESPEQRLSELPLLDKDEQFQLLVEWNSNVVDYPVTKCLHQLFQEQVETFPKKIAAVHSGKCITYGELNKKANRIAGLLQRIGVRRNDFVGILHERGLDFLAAMLGILKAGGAYIPIDPDYPEERIMYMVDDSQINTLITNTSLFKRIFQGTKGIGLNNVLCFDGKPETNSITGASMSVCFYDENDLNREENTNPDNINTSDDLAYMLYTSGSTGLPKGAMVRHDGAVNHIFAQYDELAFHNNTAFLQSAPSSSDISVWQFLAPLLIGGRTVIIDFETVCNQAELLNAIKSEKITLIELVPAVMRELLQYVNQLTTEKRSLPSLEWAMVTGEAVSVTLVNQWLHTYPGIKLVNAYGPTEAADDICQFVLDRPLPPTQQNVPIGKPLANMTILILDRNMQLVPVGVPGEICVAGIGVGKGYWRNEKKTRECFVDNPYAGNGRGKVLYRTGDLGKWLPDGTLEFLGRFDNQVKIRGFRIELGEIEGVLGMHPIVKENAVVVREDQPDEKRLAAYVVANTESVELQGQMEALKDEQISLWQNLHENSYSESPTSEDPIFNTIGWDSTYTGLPLSEKEMCEYVDHTIERIRSLNPKNVLEIGCGTGLLMFKIVQHCEKYVGTDLSQVAIQKLQQLQRSEQLQTTVKGLKEAIFKQKVANDFEGIEAGQFDTIMLCSVVQYFPSINYLMEVLDCAVKAVGPGGSIFLGDVRSLQLLEAYHTSVQLFKASDSLSKDELGQCIRQRMLQEQELAIGPEFFIALKKRFKKISCVQILPKKGTVHNEMTRFRYDVILHIDDGAASLNNSEACALKVDWVDWQKKKNDLADIRRSLEKEKPECFALEHVSNVRVHAEIETMKWLTNSNGTGIKGMEDIENVGRFREDLIKLDSKGLDPNDLWGLSEGLPYDVYISFEDPVIDNSFKALLVRRSTEKSLRSQDIYPLFDNPISIKPWPEYSNNPLQEKYARELVPQLRDFLKDRLPNHMVPTDFVMLDSMPLMPNGKVDRKSLPAPDVSRRTLQKSFVAPRNVTEEKLVGIWADTLGIKQIDSDKGFGIGIQDNFFELGGHSLKATQVVSRIHRELGVEIALRDIFKYPTVQELAGEISHREITDYKTIEKIQDDEYYPVSHAQRRLWVLSKMEGASTAYNMPEASLFEGVLDHEAFGKAFDVLVDRHESLRTTFHSVDGGPMQKVHKFVDFRLGFEDISSEKNPEERAKKLAYDDAVKPFDLERGPLFRISILKLNEKGSVLLFNMHHIISDGWSMEVMVREFVHIYESICKTKPHSLPALQIQYRDYAAWQNRLLGSGDMEQHRDYWHNKLSGPLEALNLPLDFPRPPVKTFNGKRYSFEFGNGKLSKLNSLNLRQNVSMFMTLVAITKVLIYRYTNQEDIIIGFPTAGRDHADLENQIGFYINTLVLRNTVKGDMTFESFLQQIKDTTTDSYEHQMYPFDRLVDELGLHRDVSRSPMFDVMIALQNIDTSKHVIEDVNFSPFFQEYGHSQFDLTFNFEEREGVLGVEIVFNTDLFLEERIKRMSLHFQELVESVLEDPGQTLDRLNILPEWERQKLVSGFNNVAEDFSCLDKTIIDMFEEQVEKTPDSVALVCPSTELDNYMVQKMTYRDLDSRANQIAHHLRDMGVGPNVLVGICVERSLEMVIGILGILKAGGAYVPLDPAYPKERLAFMMEDSQLQVLLTQESLLGSLPESRDAKVVCMDRDKNIISQKSNEGPIKHGTRENTAYVIYTSGSTGKPKGVLVNNYNVVRLFAATHKWFEFDQDDVWTLFHSYAFDFSVWELWGALLHGGRLVIIPHLISRSPETFYDILCKEKVSVLNQTPSAFRQLIQAEENFGISKDLDLRLVIFGGEALDIQSLKPWFDRHGDDKPQLVNMYGITETTVHVTYRPLKVLDLNSTASVIGTPIPDLHVHILDNVLQPVPIGIPGEMYISGAGLAEGYLNRPELTAEKFISRPSKEELIYKSGDLARYLPNGDIEYLGRIDTQVKISGFRIELGEIEAVMTSHPAVKEALILAQQDQYGNNSLLAYVVGDKKHVADMRRFLKEKLPDYMVPSNFFALEAFPMTPNGKIDHRALLNTDQTRPEMGPTYIGPRNDTEQIIAAVWKEILKIDKVGIHDNFFDLGANSVLIIQAHKKLREKFENNVPVVALFQHPTINALSQYLCQEDDEQKQVFQQVHERVRKQKEARKEVRQKRKKSAKITR